MTNRQIRITIIYMIMFGLCTFALGRSVGVSQQLKKYEEQKYINESVFKAYEELRNNYDVLDIQYKRDLESCYQQMGDMQDDYDVNNDGVVNSLDLLVLQQYILSQDNG